MAETMSTAIRAARALHLGQALDRVERKLPDRMVYWVERERVALKRRLGEPVDVPLGTALVPEQEMEETLADAVATLLERRPAAEIGDYLEFGVYVGTSMACMYRALLRHDIDHVRLFGFDSFEGLPESAATEDRAVWHPGMFSSDKATTERFLREFGVDLGRVTLVEGWYEHSLTPDLLEWHELAGRAGVVMVDCDLYSSTRTVLDFCLDLIHPSGTVIVLEDWVTQDLAERNLGEARAFREWLAAHPELRAEPLVCHAPLSRAFLVTRD
jgi:O-methyltransferase